MTAVLALWLLAAWPQATEHSDANPVFRALTHEGIAVRDGVVEKLPPPLMPDGLSAADQQGVLVELAGEDYDVEDLVDRSAVAPHVLKLRECDSSDGETTVRGVDFYFVVFSDLDKIADREFLGRLVASDPDDEGEGKSLSAADLDARNIAHESADEDYESYGHAAFPLFKRVRLSLTGHSFWSRTDDSIAAATRVDPRFTSDEEFPNRWQSVEEIDGDDVRLGEPLAYDAAGMYVKITRLVEPEGALFVECHIVYAEPEAWFDGANLLGSKIPAAVQTRVRAARRELIKAAR